jgi:hypothetical protein
LGAQGASAIGLAGNEVGRLVAAAVIGGTVSELTGGKFANGAASAAFAAVISQVGLSKSTGNETRANEVDNWTTEDEAWLQETMAQTAIDLENGDVYVYEPGWLRLQERSLLDGEFGSGTYTNVMDDAGGIALEGASYLAPIPIFRVGKWVIGPRGPLFGSRYFTLSSKSGIWNIGEKRIGWSRYGGQVHFERRVGNYQNSNPPIFNRC